jgi:hypothetical protein
MKNCGESTLLVAMSVSTSTSAANTRASPDDAMTARRRHTRPYAAASASRVKGPEATAANSAPGAMRLCDPWLLPWDAQSAPSNCPMSTGVPSTLSICSGLCA